MQICKNEQLPRTELYSRTQVYSRPLNVSSFSSRGKGYGFLEDSGVTNIDGRRFRQHFVSAGVTNVARVAVAIAFRRRSESAASGQRTRCYGVTMVTAICCIVAS